MVGAHTAAIVWTDQNNLAYVEGGQDAPFFSPSLFLFYPTFTSPLYILLLSASVGVAVNLC